MRTEARTLAELTPSSTLRGRAAVFLTIVVLGAAWDLASKEYVFRTLGHPGVSDWAWRLGDLVRFQLTTSFNHGALWGMGQGYAGVFAALSVVAAVGIVWFLFWHGGARSLWLTVALGFVTAGALGNLYDRLGWHRWRIDGQPVYAVRDFLDFRFLESFDWAIFNFADSFLVTGAIMLVLHSLWSDQPAATPSTSPEPSLESAEPTRPAPH
jgi:signal peptidase II